VTIAQVKRVRKRMRCDKRYKAAVRQIVAIKGGKKK
jgi:hypothetical protein